MTCACGCSTNKKTTHTGGMHLTRRHHNDPHNHRQDKTVSSCIYDRGFSNKNLRIFTTETSFITADIFSRWVYEVFLPSVEEKRAFLQSALRSYNDKAVLIMDGCTSHKIEPFLDVFAQRRIEVVFLVPHTSHLTQALDIGIFGRCKNIMRSRFQYLINLQDLDDAIGDEIEADNHHQPPSPERGKMISDFIVQILTAFHEATPPANVVSAFEQVGICSRSTGEDPYMALRETFVDPARAREVVRELGLFRDLQKIQREHRQLKITKVNEALERANNSNGGEHHRRNNSPTPTTNPNQAPLFAPTAQHHHHHPAAPSANPAAHLALFPPPVLLLTNDN